MREVIGPDTLFLQIDAKKRYAVRTNNWAESQNNALLKQRTGTTLQILINSFNYTVAKLCAYNVEANEYVKCPPGEVTEFALRILMSNRQFSERCETKYQPADVSVVEERGILSSHLSQLPTFFS